MTASNDAPGLLAEAQAIILSGGRARRAEGANKSFFQVEDRPIVEHQLERLRPIFGGRIAVVTDRPEDYAAFRLRCAPDLASEGGAAAPSSLRGLASALALDPPGWRFVLANDMPFPDARLIQLQAGRASAGAGVEAVCLAGPEGPEPFHALYHSSLAPSAARSLGRGELALRDWLLARGGLVQLGPEALRAEPERLARCLMNVNAPPAADGKS